jgi:hypothetical protein
MSLCAFFISGEFQIVLLVCTAMNSVSGLHRRATTRHVDCRNAKRDIPSRSCSKLIEKVYYILISQLVRGLVRILSMRI